MKIHSLEVVAMIARELRADGSRIVLANGCFDVPHVGHIKHLEEAKAMGDVLIVTVTQDAHVNKGVDRPLFNERIRCEVLASLECVDYVCINTPVPGEAILKIRPHLYVKGADYRHHMTQPLEIEKRAVESVGGRLAFTEADTFHSTEIIQKLG